MTYVYHIPYHWLIVLTSIIVGFIILITNKKKLISEYDISAPDTETILVSPSRLTLLSVTMIVIGGFFYSSPFHQLTRR
jgi:hypothetical protein